MQLQARTIFLALLVFFTLLASAAASERRFRVINASNGLSDNSAQVVVCTYTGRMVIASHGNLNFYNGVSFYHIDTQPEYIYHIPQYQGNTHVYFDKKHHLWLKDQYALTCVDLMQEKFVSDVDSVMRHVMDCPDQVLDLFTDSLGHAWLLTEKGLYGVNQKRHYPVLRERNLQDVFVRDSLLYLFYDNGEEVGQDLGTGRVAHRTRAYGPEDGDKYGKTSVILAYGDGLFQIRNGDSRSVLLYFNLKTLQWSVVTQLPYRMNNMAMERGGHILYIVSSYGYWTYDTVTREQNHVSELTLSNGHKQLMSCNSIAFDRQGGMWLATERRGMYYSRPAASRFTTYPWESPEARRYAAMMSDKTQIITEFGGRQANCMYTDSRGWTWFGTTKGLYMYKTPQSEPAVFSKSNGLLNNVIHAVVEDKEHNVWVSTSCGISCIMFEDGKPVFVNSFNQDDNVPNESFANGKALCLDDSTIVMQSLDHIVHFDPRDFDSVNKHWPMKLFPKLVKILMNGHNVQPGEEIDGNVIIDRAITRTYDLTLNADQNTISLTFTGLNYFRPLQTYYRVRVTGPGIKDDSRVYSYYNGGGTVDSRGQFHLPLVSLKPGDYRVEVQVSMFPNEWPADPVLWTVHVSQPWWRTTGVFIVLVLILLGLAVANFYIFNQNTKMRMRRNNQEGDMIRKLKSFVDNCDGMAHEVLKPTQADIYSAGTDESMKLQPAFVDIMLKLIPFVRQQKGSKLSMSQLSKAAHVDIVEFYDIVSANLYKNPRQLSILLKLQDSLKLLTETDKSVDEIAKECGFYTPNYFIGNFFHQYKVTPLEYREENRPC